MLRAFKAASTVNKNNQLEGSRASHESILVNIQNLKMSQFIIALYAHARPEPINFSSCSRTMTDFARSAKKFLDKFVTEIDNKQVFFVGYVDLGRGPAELNIYLVADKPNIDISDYDAKYGKGTAATAVRIMINRLNGVPSAIDTSRPLSLSWADQVATPRSPFSPTRRLSMLLSNGRSTPTEVLTPYSVVVEPPVESSSPQIFTKSPKFTVSPKFTSSP